jgi:3',5'-cyclic AMP phosphodiesterase CpdA
VSDFQCGRPFLPEAADAMVRVHENVAPDVVVVAGDLTQRAKVTEFAVARGVVARFGDVPIVMVPGNHDVPLYRFWERLVMPFRNWRAFAGPDLDSVTKVEGAVIVALNSAAPRRAIVNGRIDSRQIEFARRSFADASPGDLKILVVHHHFVAVPSGEGGSPLPGAERLATAFARMEVDVVLGGHVHQVHIRPSAGLPFVATGTTTSRRGRGPEVGGNSLCVHRFQDSSLEVTPYRRAADGADFEAGAPVEFSLRDRGAAQAGGQVIPGGSP